MQVGDKVHYAVVEIKNGIVKSIQDKDYCFVVYNCAGNWDEYAKYTGVRTRITDLKIGWF